MAPGADQCCKRGRVLGKQLNLRFNPHSMSRFLFILLLLFSVNLSAQSPADWWYFGNNAGVHFTSNGPAAVTSGKILTAEGCSSISDNQGNLLFYTDGMMVYTSNHDTMPNGTGLEGNPSSSHSGVIVPKPNSTKDYYIFTADAGPFSEGLHYSSVDLNLNSGFGDVVASEKNIQLSDSTDEKIAVVAAPFGYWVITHKDQSDEFLSFKVTSSGVNQTSVLSSTGHHHNGGFGFCMAANQEGTQLAATFLNIDSVYLYDFDLSTGKITNTIAFKQNYIGNLSYGLEFSPNGQLLYLSAWNSCTISQFDLTAGSSSAITASEVSIGDAAPGGGNLQLGPDGKIYGARTAVDTISVINSPNIIGAACGFNSAGVSLNGKECRFGLPFVWVSLKSAQVHHQGHCQNDSVWFTSETYGIDSVNWNFGDPGSGANNSSSLDNPAHLFSDSGWFEVLMLAYHPGGIDSIYDSVYIHPNLVLELGPDTFRCGNDSVHLEVFFPGASYNWNTADSNSSIWVNQGGTYTVTLTNVCDTLIDSIFIEDNPVSQGIIDTVFMSDSIELIGPTGTNHIWSTGDSTMSIIVNDTGWYSVNYKTVFGCPGEASIFLTQSDFVGADEFDVHSYSVYPNPVSDQFHIRGDLFRITSIGIYNLTGQLVCQPRLVSVKSQNAISSEMLESGLYFIVLESSKDQEVIPIIKE